MSSENDIAIVGMALRVPGAQSTAEFWRNLCAGREALRQFSAQELKSEGVSPALIDNPDYVRAGMPLSGFDQFDAEFFGFSPMEAAVLDPQHRQFYEVAWEALESAGCVPEDFTGAVGVFAGCGAGTYFHQHVLRSPDLLRTMGYFLLRHTGNDKDFLASRVSYAFNLRGPSMSVQTACSTSLVAVHLAVQSLLARETDLALAGGVTIELPQLAGYLFRQGEILSPDGHCRPFDHRAQGTVFGSGVGVVALRRLADALRDGDHVHAVIRGSAVNNDGSSKVGYLAPSVEGQAAAVAEAIAMAGVDSDSIGYVECHGTGTPIGDPIEIAALTQAFRESGSAVGHCLIGSVKSNIGHLDTAAGVAGLIKTALALENGIIPPSINFEAPNSALGLEGSPFRVASAVASWPARPTPRRAAVNSLGVGGTNAFIVLEQPPPAGPQPAAAEDVAQNLIISAHSRAALDEYQTRLAQWLREHREVPLAQVAHTLGLHRRVFAHRRVLAARNSDEAAQILESSDVRRLFNHSAGTERLSTVFMFPGGGAQYPGMARGLYERMPAFRGSMDEGFRILQQEFGTDLRPAFADDVELQRPSVQLPLIFLIEYALVALWESLGVRPEALIGHSMGENAAACVAGVMSLRDALGLVLLRGRLMDEVPDGGMLSVPMSATDLAQRLGTELDLAAANSPLLSIASGPNAALDDLQARLTAEGIEARRVRIQIAAHSRMLEGILGRFREYLRGIRLQAPRIPVVSNLTGNWLTDQQATDPEYWVRHLRNTVRFADGVQLLLQDKSRLYVEVGPGNILGSFVRQSHDSIVQRVFASLRHADDPVGDDVHFRAVAGRLHASGLQIPPRLLWPDTWRKALLPTYGFQHARYWIDPATPDAWHGEDALFPERAGLGAEWFWEPRWLQQGIAAGSPAPPQLWCVFHHGDELAVHCIATLRTQGHRVIEVLSGDALVRVDEHTWSLAPEAGGAGYDELLQRLVDENSVPDRILHTWLLTRSETFRPGQTFLHRNQVHGFYSLFHLARAFSRRAEGKRSHWIVLSNGSASVQGEPLPYPEKNTVLGPCQVIPREIPNITCSHVDIWLDDAQAAASLTQELEGPAVNAVLAWRSGVRWLRYVAPSRQTDMPPLLLREGGTYLLTGGYGGVAAVVAEWLARNYRARLVLMSRTPLPDRSDWGRWLAENPPEDAISRAIRRVRLLESLGAKVRPVAADVAVAEQVEDALRTARSAVGPINGVFHAAGVLHDDLIALKSEREIEDVFAPKLYGTLVLDRALRDEPLDFFILFSSVSAFVAPAGQADYVAASTFLNAFAESCRDTREWPVLSIDWGIWKDVGMAGGLQQTLNGHDTAAPSPGQARRGAPEYPLFDSIQVFQEGREQLYAITGHVSTRDTWIVDDHRLVDGQSLFPGTGYLELIRAALQTTGLCNGPWTALNLRLIEPFFIDENAPSAFRIRLHGSADRWHFQLGLGNGNDSGANRVVVATADIRLASAGGAEEQPLDIAGIASRCSSSIETATGDASLRVRQEAHLKFGPRWQVLHSLRLSATEALAVLRLRPALVPDLDTYSLHPGLLDIATGCAMDLIPGYGEQEVPQHLWVPVRYGVFCQLRPLPADFVSWIRLSKDFESMDGVAAFDVVLADTDGSPLGYVRQLTLRRLARPLLAAATASARAGDTRLERPGDSPGEQALRHNRAHGITEGEGVVALERIFSSPGGPVLLSTSIRPDDLTRQAHAVALLAQSATQTAFARPRLESEFESPRDELERSLAETWGRLLGIQGVGIRDSFFELGGHSLIAVRLFNEISERYKIDLPMSALIQHPDIAGLAERLRGGPPGASLAEDTGPAAEADRTFLHAVPIKSGPVGDGTPIFVVAGMFGNVLNLSHLANLLGEDRAFFALQARGLYGNQSPHESFEDMARDYVEELRRIQPRGPYFIGGFSGGGLVAFEMVRQLETLGERTAALILLDTPIREPVRLSLLNKIEMWLPGLRREGPAFLLQKIRARRKWRRELAATEHERREEGSNPAGFHSRRVGDAFLRGLEKYRVGKADVEAILFRPRQTAEYRLRDGRQLDSDRNVLLPDNGWTAHVSTLRVIEVPGNHDSMVLEPNVRVLAATLRRVLRMLERNEGQG